MIINWLLAVVEDMKWILLLTVTGTQSNKKFITVIKRRSYNGREQSRRI